MQYLRTLVLALAAGVFLTACEDNDTIIAGTGNLRVEVRDPLGNVVPVADVFLYATYADYVNDTDPEQALSFAYAQSNGGSVTFNNLNQGTVYAYAQASLGSILHTGISATQVQFDRTASVTVTIYP